MLLGRRQALYLASRFEAKVAHARRAKRLASPIERFGSCHVTKSSHVLRVDATNYRKEGYMGCLLGGLGQELSGVSQVFRRTIEACFSEIATRIAVCLEQARKRGDIPADSDTRRMASLLVDCWEGAALRSRLRGNAAPLKAMLNFYFQSAVGR
ncbi:MAG: TetR family transcriptional regulator C-terminal domain-containing protein [Candidatus Limnocylindrales bacterium]